MTLHEKLTRGGFCTPDRASKVENALDEIHSVISSLDLENRDLVWRSFPALIEAAEAFGRDTPFAWDDANIKSR